MELLENKLKRLSKENYRRKLELVAHTGHFFMILQNEISFGARCRVEFKLLRLDIFSLKVCMDGEKKNKLYVREFGVL